MRDRKESPRYGSPWVCEKLRVHAACYLWACKVAGGELCCGAQECRELPAARVIQNAGLGQPAISSRHKGKCCERLQQLRTACLQLIQSAQCIQEERIPRRGWEL